MECIVPVADRCVVLPKGEFEEVVIVVAHKRAFDTDIVGRRFRSEADFAEIAHLRRKGGSKVQHKLAQVEAARCSLLIGGCEIDVSKTSYLQWGIVDCRFSNRGSVVLMIARTGSAG